MRLVNPIVSVGGILAVLYLACVVGVVIYVLTLLARFVSAHERAVNALETIARKLRDDYKP